MTVVMVAVTGCTSISSVQRADTLGRGTVQVAVEAGAGLLQGPLLSVQLGGIGPIGSGPSLDGLPQFDAAIRAGVTDSVDVGARAGLSGLELHTKVRLTEASSRVILSVVPTVGTNGTTVSAALPVLVGLRLGPHELTLGLRPVVLVSSRTPALGFIPAASLGVALQVFDRFTLMPEVAFSLPMMALGDAGLSTLPSAATPLVLFKLGFHFDVVRR